MARVFTSQHAVSHWQLQSSTTYVFLFCNAPSSGGALGDIQNTAARSGRLRGGGGTCLIAILTFSRRYFTTFQRGIHFSCVVFSLRSFQCFQVAKNPCTDFLGHLYYDRSVFLSSSSARSTFVAINTRRQSASLPVMQWNNVKIFLKRGRTDLAYHNVEYYSSRTPCSRPL